MPDRLTGKIALITGGASGIGADCARVFSKEGARVFVADLNEDEGAAVAREVGGDFLSLDVSQEEGWIAALAAIGERCGRLDILVNNAGIFVVQNIEETELEDWNRQLAVNLTGTMLGCKHAIRAMKENPGGPSGSIVNMSSIAGFIGRPQAAAYTASKGGVRLLTKAVAVHCANKYRAIRCNSLHPGVVDTPLNQAATRASADPQAMRAFLDNIQPMGRMATSEEMARCALFLASDDASFVTGTELVVDGGWLAAAGSI